MWGLNWPLWKIALRDTGPWEFTALRCSIATAALVAFMLATRRSLVPRPLGPLVLIGLLQGVGMNGFSMAAVGASGATKATILAYTMPFWTVLFARLILHEEVRKRQWVAVALGAVGLAVMVAPHASIISEVGATYAVAGGLCWALGTIVWKWTAQRHALEPMTVVTWQNLFAIVPLGVAAFAAREMPIHWDGVFVFALAYNVFVTAVLAWLLWFAILQRVPAVTAGMSSLAIPVVSIVTSYLVLGERPEPLQWVGIVTILLALLVVTTASVVSSAAATR